MLPYRLTGCLFHSMIGYWHHTYVYPSVCDAVHCSC